MAWLRHDRITVGVTGPDDGGASAWAFTALAIALAGGRAVRITPSHPRDPADLDALVLGGGADVEPHHYGMEASGEHAQLPRADKRTLGRHAAALLLYPLIHVMRRNLAAGRGDAVAETRDTLELGLLTDAVARQLPVLGICRGAQLMNIHFGGTLHQDITGFYRETPFVRSILPRKPVRIEPASRLASILGTRRCMVNALHRQAVDRLGEGLAIVARDATGVVQAVEHRGLPFAVGVQWHPEYLPQHHRQRRLFATLVRAAEMLREKPR